MPNITTNHAITYTNIAKHSIAVLATFAVVVKGGALLFDSFAFVVTALLDDLAIRQPARVGNSSKNRAPLA